MNKEQQQQQVEEAVVAELRARKVKLWMPPFIVLLEESTNSNHVKESTTRRPNMEALQELAKSLSSSSTPTLSCYAVQDIHAALLSKQAYTISKYETKQTAQENISCLEITVIGLVVDDIPQDDRISTESWAERVEFLPRSLKLHNVNAKLTVDKFLQELAAVLQVSSVRISHKGKPVTNSKKHLAQILLQACKVPKNGDGGVKTTMLCQVTPQEAATPLSPEQALIQSIRNAASKLSGSADIDVTDQHGNHVPMLARDRLAFLTALGLARLGQQHLHQQHYDSALVFLLQADQEWNAVDAQWRNRVDNYGILQLDIAWTYLQLNKAERLQDATRRLQVAENVLLKQVNCNFCTLALAMADMEKQVPPLAAVFCRLYLLQGVAYRYAHHLEMAKNKLEWAYQVCAALRSASPTDMVASLCEAVVGISPQQAISALRRTNGNPDQAVELLETERVNAQSQEEKLRAQHKLGLCQNTINYVNMELVVKLQSVLGMATTSTSPTSVASSSLLQQEVQQTNHDVAVGLLRLANNDIPKAIDIYQDVERSSDAVLQRVEQLNQILVNQGLEAPAAPKRRASRKRSHDAVDDVALATLVSMGVEEPLAKKALRASQNNVDASLVWLTRKDDDESAIRENHVDAASDAANEDNASMVDSNASEDEEELEERAEPPAVDQMQLEFEEAMDLLQRELGGALQTGDFDEYLGSSLDEEWEYLQRFIGGDMVWMQKASR